MESCSASIKIRRIQIKATLNCRFSHHLAKKESHQFGNHAMTGKGMQKQCSHQLMVKAKTLQVLWPEQLGNKFLPKLKCVYPLTQKFHYSHARKHVSSDICTRLFPIALLMIIKLEMIYVTINKRLVK